MGARTEKHEVRILLAEDNHINCKLAIRMLSKLGYNTDAVINGREAIDALRSRPYDIVLMDLQMPEMDGIAATRWILSNPREIVLLPNIIALTANTLPEDEKRCLDSGMVDFIPKPIGLDRLSNVIVRWTRQR